MGADDLDKLRLGFSATAAPSPRGGTMITVVGELDATAAPRLGELLERAIDDENAVELDLRACSFVDSSGIAAIVRAARQLGERGRTLVLIGVRERVRATLELTGLLEHRWVELEDVPREG